MNTFDTYIKSLQGYNTVVLQVFDNKTKSVQKLSTEDGTWTGKYKTEDCNTTGHEPGTGGLNYGQRNVKPVFRTTCNEGSCRQDCFDAECKAMGRTGWNGGYYDASHWEFRGECTKT